MDMSAAYAKGVTEALPQAQISLSHKEIAVRRVTVAGS
jgi:hypothetical protein